MSPIGDGVAAAGAAARGGAGAGGRARRSGPNEMSDLMVDFFVSDGGGSGRRALGMAAGGCRRRGTAKKNAGQGAAVARRCRRPWISRGRIFAGRDFSGVRLARGQPGRGGSARGDAGRRQDERGLAGGGAARACWISAGAELGAAGLRRGGTRVCAVDGGRSCGRPEDWWPRGSTGRKPLGAHRRGGGAGGSRGGGAGAGAGRAGCGRRASECNAVGWSPSGISSLAEMPRRLGPDLRCSLGKGGAGRWWLVNVAPILERRLQPPRWKDPRPRAPV